MGNANGREEEERDDGEGLENGDLMSPSSVVGRGASTTSRSVSVLDSNGVHNHNNNSPPDHAPARSSSPFLFPPQMGSMKICEKEGRGRLVVNHCLYDGLVNLLRINDHYGALNMYVMLTYCGLELGWVDFSSSIAVLCVRKGVISLVDVVAPVAPLRRPDVSPVFDQIRQNESHEAIDEDQPAEKGIPTVIIWSYGGNDVAVKGSWDNFTSMKRLQRSGKDHSILLVLPSGIYHYKLIVDGESKYIPDLPSVTDEMGCVCNLLDVHDYVPENIDSAVEFEAPPSPDHTYSQAFPAEDDFTKDPSAAPPQLHLTVLDEASSSKPQHVVLNHLYIEKGWASQSLVALGLTHRFQSKYVTVCLYKPLKR
ncbi:hypothetical protein DKX38_024435 [Salix brachista]|uniref:Association with the SNF1 complex (ASC) domain-containing protein n=1 Tax=Salix brachista TaxID=2182728 RepID=A0A5N5JN81_9ROSI|nr:hypothetical protein DKX38_024435 [Salix brachista]